MSKHDIPLFVNSVASLEEKKLEFLWKYYIPSTGITLLDANPGFGKSLWTLRIAQCLTDGIRLDGCENTGAPVIGNVILMNAEDDPHAVILPRAKALGMNTNRLFIATDPNGPINLRNMEAFECLINVLNPRLIILDPITSFIPNTDTYRDNEVRDILTPISRLSLKYRFAVLIVRHNSKSEYSNAQYQGGGSYAGFVGTARSQLVLGYDTDGNKCLGHTKINAGKEGATIRYDIRNLGTNAYGNDSAIIDIIEVIEDIDGKTLKPILPREKIKPRDDPHLVYRCAAMLIADTYTIAELMFTWEKTKAETKQIIDTMQTLNMLKKSENGKAWLVNRAVLNGNPAFM